MDRNDKTLALSLISVLAALVLIVYAPIALPSNSFAAKLWSVANSAFMIALIGSLAGAFAGAMGAQIIAERNAERKNLSAEIAATNFAIAASHSVVNAYLSFKKQIVVDVCSRFWLHRKNFSSAVKAGWPIAIPSEHFALDFRIFEVPFSSIELLQRELQERVRSSGASLAFFCATS